MAADLVPALPEVPGANDRDKVKQIIRIPLKHTSGMCVESTPGYLDELSVSAKVMEAR